MADKEDLKKLDDKELDQVSGGVRPNKDCGIKAKANATDIAVKAVPNRSIKAVEMGNYI